MKFHSSLLLSKNEKIIMNLLSKRGVLSFSEISSHSGVPRTSLYKPVRDLEDRDFVQTKKRGRDRLVIFKGTEFKAGDVSSREIVLLDEKGYLSEMYGTPRIEKGDRIYWLQPSIALENILKTEQVSVIADLNKKIVQSGCIVDGVLEVDYYDVYRKMVGESDFRKAAKSLLGRPYEIHMTRQALKENKEVIIFPDHAIAFDWQTKTGMSSRSRVFMDLCRFYFDSVKKESKKVDVSEMLRGFVK